MSGHSYATAGTKQELSLDAPMVAEMRDEAKRAGRSISWAAQCAWRKARKSIRSLPGVEVL